MVCGHEDSEHWTGLEVRCACLTASVLTTLLHGFSKHGLDNLIGPLCITCRQLGYMLYIVISIHVLTTLWLGYYYLHFGDQGTGLGNFPKVTELTWQSHANRHHSFLQLMFIKHGLCAGPGWEGNTYFLFSATLNISKIFFEWRCWLMQKLKNRHHQSISVSDTWL